MMELLNLQQQCLNLIQAYPECGQNCALNHYCTSVRCTIGNCSRCLNQIQYGQPNFTYSCTKITYQYVLRFFNRFASEICYAMCLYNYKNISRINVVSLGCGPGSEVYGIIKALRFRKIVVPIYYEGHDLLDVWEPVQNLCRNSLTSTQHIINFHTTNLFADFAGFDNNVVNLLILNYLLSHAAKFYTKQGKNQFVDEIVDFIIQNNVKNVLFNDISYYGNNISLNSGVQLMKLMISKFSSKGVKYTVRYACFPSDPYRGNEGWQFYKKNNLLFQKLNGNNFMNNVDYCNSKQIFVHILQ
jgi:hypothetical protein